VKGMGEAKKRITPVRVLTIGGAPRTRAQKAVWGKQSRPRMKKPPNVTAVLSKNCVSAGREIEVERGKRGGPRSAASSDREIYRDSEEVVDEGCNI